MKTGLKSLEATIDRDGQVHLLKPVKLDRPAKAVVTILPDDADEAALLSEPSLAEDWNRLEEDEAWSHLQPDPLLNVGSSAAIPYARFVAAFAALVNDAKSFPLGGFPPAPRPATAPDASKALFFAPHPDDETIVGALALRIFREAKMNLVNVAVTQGSKQERQTERLAELRNACNYLGYGLQTTVPNGLEKVGVKTRQNEPQRWAEMVQVIADILRRHNPRVILFPHERDWNGTHIGVHYLVMDALKQLPVTFECYTVETEFWGAMDDPNLMVEVNADDLADLITATTFHVGEVNRNPYHLLLPAWMMDNVRRGAELVGGQGGAAPDFTFAALYRLRKWSQGRSHNVFTSGKFLSKSENPASLFS